MTLSPTPDPGRVQIVKQTLGTAVDRGLQVILLTCDPRAHEGFEYQEIRFSNSLI